MKGSDALGGEHIFHHPRDHLLRLIDRHQQSVRTSSHSGSEENVMLYTHTIIFELTILPFLCMDEQQQQQQVLGNGWYAKKISDELCSPWQTRWHLECYSQRVCVCLCEERVFVIRCGCGCCITFHFVSLSLLKSFFPPFSLPLLLWASCDKRSRFYSVSVENVQYILVVVQFSTSQLTLSTVDGDSVGKQLVVRLVARSVLFQAWFQPSTQWENFAKRNHQNQRTKLLRLYCESRHHNADKCGCSIDYWWGYPMQCWNHV